MTTFTKKEIYCFMRLLDSQGVSINPEEIEEEIEHGVDCFGFKSMEEAIDLYIKLQDLRGENND